MVPPWSMCRAHLLGEHREVHAICGILRAGKDLSGYYANRLLELPALQRRHDALAREMQRRGFSHRSPFAFDVHGWLRNNPQPLHAVPRRWSLGQLHQRCPACAELYRQGKPR